MALRILFFSLWAAVLFPWWAAYLRPPLENALRADFDLQLVAYLLVMLCASVGFAVLELCLQASSKLRNSGGYIILAFLGICVLTATACGYSLVSLYRPEDAPGDLGGVARVVFASLCFSGFLTWFRQEAIWANNPDLFSGSK